MKVKGGLLAALPSFFFFLACASTEGDCSSSCGKITNISYPFRLRDDPSCCGKPEYELTCQDNQTLLNLSSRSYVVKAISYDNQTIRFLDPGLQSNNCSSLPKYSWASWYSSDIGGRWYTRVDRYNYVMYLTCQQPVNDSAYVSTSPCINSTNEYHYWALFQSYSVPDVPKLCKSSEVLVDFLADGNALSYLEIWSFLLSGVQLSWRAFQCPGCEAKGGSCYYRDTYEISNGEWCDIYSSHASQSRHCFFKYLWSDIEVFGLRFITIAGYVLAARTALGMLCLFSYLIYKLRKQHLSKNESIELFLENYKNMTPTRYSHSDIKKMTRGFKEKLGQGGFGSVFKGRLPGGRPVAIKILGKTRSNGEEFISEVATIGRIHHVNVVQLIGFCSEGSKRALIYDYMPNGSLDKYIYLKQDRSSTLALDKMYDIALGIARGIEYLHRGCDMQILHFDIKPHNILLDENFTPKVSDFGLAKLYPTGRSKVSVTGAKGTIGYIAPELIYRNFGNISYKSDVYSFGRLLLEMIGSRNSPRASPERDSSQFYLPAWLHDQLLKEEEGEVVDVELVEHSGSVLTKKLVMVGLWCIQLRPDDRPSMHRVVEMLEGSLEELPMPPRPSLLFPSDPIEEADIVETASTDVESSYMLGV